MNGWIIHLSDFRCMDFEVLETVEEPEAIYEGKTAECIAVFSAVSILNRAYFHDDFL